MFNTSLRHRSRKTLVALSLALATFSPFALTGCGGGSSSGSNTLPPPNSSAVSKSITSAGGAISLAAVNGVAYTLNFPATAVATTTTVTVTPIDSSKLAVPITRGASGRSFTADVGNTYVTAFSIDGGGVTKFNAPVTVSATGLTAIATGTVLNIAELTNNQWNDVGTLVVNAGNLSSQLASYVAPGILSPGTYVIYKPSATITPIVSNLGVTLIADDQDTGAGMQIINLFDTSGHALAKPVLKTVAYTGASDLDGQAMTPDGKYGILVDGGNTVRFFSGVDTGVPLASTNTVDISAYGGDGDSVAIMPRGDEAVVAGDSSQLLVVSGISSGTPATAITIDAPSSRDGVVISNDGKVLMARGSGGLTVYSIKPITPVTGALGGQSAYTYTQTMDIPAAGTVGLEDGRDGMAISPTDSSRAVLVGSNGATTVELYTGLPNNPTRAVLPIRLPAGSVPHQTRAAAKRRGRSVTTLTGVNSILSVAITPDGKNAIVGTDAGLVLLTGVDTGTLTQVGAVYAPTFTVGGTPYTLGAVPSLTVTLDNKNVVVCAPQPSYSSGSLLVIPFTSAGFGTIAGQLDGLSLPSNDQILIH